MKRRDWLKTTAVAILALCGIKWAPKGKGPLPPLQAGNTYTVDPPGACGQIIAWDGNTPVWSTKIIAVDREAGSITVEHLPPPDIGHDFTVIEDSHTPPFPYQLCPPNDFFIKEARHDPRRAGA